MGSSDWSYITYERDLQRALDKLRRRIFLLDHKREFTP
jgi:hypothetical protein